MHQSAPIARATKGSRILCAQEWARFVPKGDGKNCSYTHQNI